MFKPSRTQHQVIKILNNSLIDLPAPTNISLMWNYGSLLGLCLIMQIISGVFLSMHYVPNTELAFNSIIHITKDMNYGWLMRYIHMNGASLYFLFLYIHIGRGIYYQSYLFTKTWITGIFIFIISMATAFMGYVLPWGQMSFWGATVITNLFSVMPYMGSALVEWLWGGFTVNNATLNRFFVIHFMLPIMTMALVIIHIMFLHQTGSSNPIGLNSNSDRVPFHQFYSTKDMMMYMIMFIMFTLFIMFNPNTLSEPENFTMSNPLMTPTHIKPEWYFLWLYAILRSVPNKLGGVLAMLFAVLILFIMPLLSSTNSKTNSLYPMNQTLFWIMSMGWMMLTWIGGHPVNPPFTMITKLLTMMYFAYFIMNPLATHYWDKTINM